MPFQKFGRSDDQKVLSDDDDKQGVQKRSSRFSDKDRSDLMREVNEEADRQDAKDTDQ